MRQAERAIYRRGWGGSANVICNRCGQGKEGGGKGGCVCMVCGQRPPGVCVRGVCGRVAVCGAGGAGSEVKRKNVGIRNPKKKVGPAGYCR